MLSFFLSKSYLQAPDVLQKIGEYAKKYGDKVLIISGKTALSLTKSPIFASLDAAKISHQTEVFSGHATEAQIKHYAKIASDFGAKIIIGIGGGRVLDVAKASGALIKTPVFTVPTVPATCAAFAALSIYYDEEGRFSKAVALEESPHYIFADTTILQNAPRRFLHAGIADTVVKWYETIPNVSTRKTRNSLGLRLLENISRFTLDTVENALNVSDQGKQFADQPEAFSDILDAIILLAGISGSIKDGKAYNGFAHPFYNAATHEKTAFKVLHGETVIFGLLTQFVLEGKAEAEISAYAKRLRALDLPISLAGIGLNETQIKSLAERIESQLEGTAFYNKINAIQISEAIFQADILGNQLLLQEKNAAEKSA